eukprot:TRINITY_DN62190_c0_g1_i1.p1 TRINITY_DN62190_c0_g1~~TRINITY_DN62190_c0_g1_i1.p1  ORF type:complete len:362 (+),score=72.56 TRINITY_DN62190_c0_g1_i1:38-1087(+)
MSLSKASSPFWRQRLAVWPVLAPHCRRAATGWPTSGSGRLRSGRPLLSAVPTNQLLCSIELPQSLGRAAWGGQALHRCSSTVAVPPSSPGGSSSSSSSSSSSAASPGWTLRRGVLTLLKLVCVWTPAAFVWIALVSGAPLLDLRTPEEVQEEENEVLRLERFFDVAHLPEAEYLTEWSAKEEALSKIIDKLLKSKRYLRLLTDGPEDTDEAGRSVSESGLGAARSDFQLSSLRKKAQGSSDEASASAVEFSYILPPAEAADAAGTMNVEPGEEGFRPWRPRLIFSHASGSLALITLCFQHLNAAKDRDEKWTCTALRAELVAAPGGEPMVEPLCDLEGPLPHGVRYMRI